MQKQSTSAPCDRQACVFCKASIRRGAVVWRAWHPYHVKCVVRTLALGHIAHDSSTLWHGLLPAGKDRNVRRSNLNKTKSATTEVGGHA